MEILRGPQYALSELRAGESGAGALLRPLRYRLPGAQPGLCYGGIRAGRARDRDAATLAGGCTRPGVIAASPIVGAAPAIVGAGSAGLGAAALRSDRDPTAVAGRRSVRAVA